MPRFHQNEEVRLADQGAGERDEGDTGIQNGLCVLPGENSTHQDQRQLDACPGIQHFLKEEGLLIASPAVEIHSADLHAIHARLLKQAEQAMEVTATVAVCLDQQGEIRTTGGTD